MSAVARFAMRCVFAGVFSCLAGKRGLTALACDQLVSAGKFGWAVSFSHIGNSAYLQYTYHAYCAYIDQNSRNTATRSQKAAKSAVGP